MKNQVVTELAKLVDARLHCIKANNDFGLKHEAVIKALLQDAPSGSGIDNRTKLDLDLSTGEKLVFHISYHHMNENGMYDDWTDHILTVTPSLMFGFNIKISGKNKNDIKDYLAETYDYWLSQEVTVGAE